MSKEKEIKLSIHLPPETKQPKYTILSLAHDLNQQHTETEITLEVDKASDEETMLSTYLELEAPEIQKQPKILEIVSDPEINSSEDLLRFLQKIAKENPNLQQLHFSRNPYVTDEVVQFIVENFPQLKTLEMSRCPNIKNSSLVILASAPVLKKLTLVGCFSISGGGILHLSKSNSLKFFNFNDCPNIPSKLRRTFFKMADLKEELQNVGYIKKEVKEQKTAANSDSQPLLSRTKTMKEIAKEVGTDRNSARKAAASKARKLNKLFRTAQTPLELNNLLLYYAKIDPDLSELYLCNLNTLRASTLRIIRENFLELETLTLKDCQYINDKDLTNLHSAPELQNFNIINCQQITDRTLDDLFKIRELENFTIVDCHKITNEGARFLSHLPKLKTLTLASQQITLPGLEILTNSKPLEKVNVKACPNLPKNLQQSFQSGHVTWRDKLQRELNNDRNFAHRETKNQSTENSAEETTNSTPQASVTQQVVQPITTLQNKCCCVLL